MTGFVKVRLKTIHNPTIRLRAYIHVFIMRTAVLSPFAHAPTYVPYKMVSACHPALHNTTPPVTKRLTNASGITTFHPNDRS